MTYASKFAGSLKLTSALKLLGATLLVTLSSGLYAADEAPKPAADAAKQAVAVRKAAFTLIASASFFLPKRILQMEK